MDNIIQETVRPSRVDGGAKDKEYHRKYGRYCISSATNNVFHRIFILNTIIYWRFYSNDQWILDDDLSLFLSDESGNARNRLRVVENIIRPMVKQYIGNAIRLNFNVKAVNISPFAISRREAKLGEMQFMTDMANAIPSLKEEFRQKYGIGDSKEETDQLFETYFIDEYTKAVNHLLKYVKEKNNFEEHIVQIAKHTALAGIGIHKGYEQNGEQMWDVVDPLFYLFDRSAKREDLKDAGYMGEQLFMNPADIFERFQNISSREREAVEKYAIQNYGSIGYLWHLYNANRDRVPVYEMYWKDVDKQEYGYVIDEFGYEYLARINYSEDEDQKPKYTDKDLITPKTENYKKFLGKNNKSKKIVKYVDVVRYCILSPAEVIGGNLGDDVVYEWGILPYQETYGIDPSMVEYPYKVYCSDYHNGEILSPIQTVIDPQRLLNRTISIMESHMNNARGSNVAYDKTMVDPQGGEEELIRNMNLSKPVGLMANRTGIQNAMVPYGSNLGNELNPFMQIAQLMRTVGQNVSGVNEAMEGTGTKSNELVGVQQLKIDRGSLMQEKFYYGINNIMLQTFQAIASQGKRIYADSKRKITIISGDRGAEEILITQDMKNEDMHVFIKQSEPDDMEKQNTNQIILQLQQLGMLGEHQVAEIFNKGDMELVSQKMREWYNEKQIMSAMKSKQDAQQAQKMQEDIVMNKQQIIANRDVAEKRDDFNMDKEHQYELEKQLLKDEGKMRQIREKEAHSK